jgi:sugar phosphate isomerase/epimerase
VVIVHPGQVDVDPALEQTLHELYRQGASGEPRFARARDHLRSARAARAEPAMRSVLRSLAELAECAAGLGVRLGLENRFHYPEIPQPDELEQLLALDRGGVIGYWHDVGHAQVMEHLGFGRHEDWLSRFAGRIVGVHLHDVDGLQDHLAPGRGRMDWGMVARYLPAAALRTCEVQSFNPPEDVAAGLLLLIRKGIMEMGDEQAP